MTLRPPHRLPLACLLAVAVGLGHAGCSTNPEEGSIDLPSRSAESAPKPKGSAGGKPSRAASKEPVEGR